MKRMTGATRGDPNPSAPFHRPQSVVCPQIHTSFDRKGVDRGEVAFAGAVPSEAKVQADSVIHRRELLAADHTYGFTWIQKFQVKSKDRRFKSCQPDESKGIA
jgi:hypothetical protein